MPQSLPDSSSQNRVRSLYCGSRQPACALSLLRGCGGGLSTGRADAGRAERAEWSELSELPSALSAAAEAPGTCQSCCAAHASKQARRAGSLPDSALQWRQALLSAPVVAGMVCASAAPAGASAASSTALARDGTRGRATGVSARPPAWGVVWADGGCGMVTLCYQKQICDGQASSRWRSVRGLGGLGGLGFCSELGAQCLELCTRVFPGGVFVQFHVGDEAARLRGHHVAPLFALARPAHGQRAL